MVADDSFKERVVAGGALHLGCPRIHRQSTDPNESPTVSRRWAEELMERVFKVFANRDPRWETLVAPSGMQRTTRKAVKAVPNATPELLAYISTGQQISDVQDDPVVSGLLSMVEHNRKLTLGRFSRVLMPLLVKLTAGNSRPVALSKRGQH